MKRTLMMAGLAYALLPPFFRTATTLQRERTTDGITRTKRRDQHAKLARRAERQANDAQLWQRQRAKWG